MSFVKINGLDVDVDRDGGLDRSYADVEYYERSEGMTLEGCTHREVREYSFSVPVVRTDAGNQALRGWIKGRGHHWTFERVDGATTRFTKFPTDGGPGFGSSSTLSSTSKFGTWGISVGLGLTSTASVSFGSEDRYSVSVWKRDSGGTYVLCTVVADGTTTTSYAGAAGTATTTAFAWLTLSAASGHLGVGLIGKNQAGTDAAAIYDGLMVVPYALTTTQLAARNARTVAEPAFPYVELDGDCLEDLQPLVVKGFIGSEASEQITERGAVVNVRIPTVRLVQR